MIITTRQLLFLIILPSVIAAISLLAFAIISSSEEQEPEYFPCMLHIDYHYPEQWYQNSTLTLNLLLNSEPIPDGDGDIEACSGVLLTGEGTYIGAVLTNTNTGNLIWGKEFPREGFDTTIEHDWSGGFTCKPGPGGDESDA